MSLYKEIPMNALPEEKQWEMYEAVMTNCNNCSTWKKETEKRITGLEIFVGSITAVGAVLYGILLFVGGFFQGSLNFIVHK